MPFISAWSILCLIFALMSSFIILCIGFKNFSLFFKNILWRLKIEHFCKCLQWWIKHKCIWVARLSVKHCCIDSLSISYFKIKSKLTYMYFFMILSDFSAIRSNQRSFFAISVYMIIFTMMNTAAVFLLWEFL